jgi:hypothetical protein
MFYLILYFAEAGKDKNHALGRGKRYKETSNPLIVDIQIIIIYYPGIGD